MGEVVPLGTPMAPTRLPTGSGWPPDQEAGVATREQARRRAARAERGKNRREASAGEAEGKQTELLRAQAPLRLGHAPKVLAQPWAMKREHGEPPKVPAAPLLGAPMEVAEHFDAADRIEAEAVASADEARATAALGSLIGKARVECAAALRNLEDHGHKTRCWAWWVFPTDRPGEHEPEQKPLWQNQRQCLEKAVQLASEGRCNSPINGVLVLADMGQPGWLPLVLAGLAQASRAPTATTNHVPESCGALHSPCGGAPQQRGPLTPQTQTRPNRLHTHTHPSKRLAHPRSPIPPLSTLTSRATHAHPLHPAAYWLLCHIGLYKFEFEFDEEFWGGRKGATRDASGPQR